MGEISRQNSESMNDTNEDTTAAGSTNLVSGARENAGRAANALRENPLGLMLGAFALGVIGGFLFPITDLERERLGPIRDRLADTAQSVGAELGQQVMEHGKSVIADTVQAAVSGGNALEAAQQSAQQHGAQIMERVQTQFATASSNNGSGTS